MDGFLGIQPFVPAKEFDRPTGFYETLGFSLAGNCMVQLLVRDADLAWESLHVRQAAERFGTKEPIPHCMQQWGRRWASSSTRRRALARHDSPVPNPTPVMQPRSPPRVPPCTSR